jgi:hypothetical protein
VSLGDRMDIWDARLKAWGVRNAHRLYRLCLVGFFFNLALYGFAHAVVPQIAGLFGCNAALFVVGGLSNLALSANSKESNRTK